MSYAIKLNTAQRYGQNLSLEIRGSLMAYVIYSPNVDEPYRLTVSDKDGTTKTYVIDSFMYHELRKIMDDDYQWPVNCHLSFVKM